MGSWPFTRLHYGCNRCIAIAGPHIQVLDATSGTILHAQRCSSNIACSTVDETFTWLITTGEDKRLNVWKLDGLETQSSRELPKRATVVQLSRDAQVILVADKFGDVFSYPRVPPSDVPTSETKKRDAVAAHATPHGSLVLGHASIITAFLLSHDGRYILTADRDEHIRVSRFPHGHIIERYCLGHRLFLSALCLPVFDQGTLVSGGGDTSLHLWDWMSGTLRCQIPVVEVVRPFLRVRESKPQWHHVSEGTRKSRGRGRKGKKKRDDQPGSSAQNSDVAMEVVGGDEEPNSSGGGDPELVFALARIEVLNLNAERVLLFSAFGASALFYCLYPSQPSDMPHVRHVEFSRPVLDFVIGDGGHVLVSLDTSWTSPHGTDAHNPAITLLKWHDGEFNVCADVPPLVNTLNGAASLDASAAEIIGLGLYVALSLLPKNADGGEEGGGELEVDSRPDTPVQSAKVAGRMKTKQALLRRQEQGSGEEPEPKKIKLADDV